MSSGHGHSRDERVRSREQSRERRIEERESRRRQRAGEDTARLIWMRPEPGARRTRLTRDEIARAALAITDADGLEALSMRRVASELGVGTMSLYHYVETKAELLDLMHDAMMAEILVPDGELPDDWRGALEAIARRALAATRRHPWSLEGPPTAAGPNGLRHFEQTLAAVAGLAVDEQTRFDIMLMVDDYVFGYALRENEEQREHEERDEDQLDAMIEYFASLLATGDFPHVERLRRGDDPKTTYRRLERMMLEPNRFERGLKRLLDGIAAELGEPS